MSCPFSVISLTSCVFFVCLLLCLFFGVHQLGELHFHRIRRGNSIVCSFLVLLVFFLFVFVFYVFLFWCVPAWRATFPLHYERYMFFGFVCVFFCVRVLCVYVLVCTSLASYISIAL